MPAPVTLAQGLGAAGSFDRGEILIRTVGQWHLASVWWIVGGIGLVAVAWFFLTRVQQRLWWIVLVPLAGIGAVAAIGGGIALTSGSTRTVADVVGLAPYDTADGSLLRAPVGRWPRGAVVEVTIPDARSTVGALPASVYLPPQFFTGSGPFPVVFVIPDAPAKDARDPAEPVAEVFDEGGVVDAALSAANAGRPVVLVVPAVSPVGEQTQCIDGVLGPWETYLADDVVAWAARQPQFGVQNQLSAIGGVAMGGYCAQITALRNHADFGWSGNISGTTSLDYPGGNEAILGSGRGITDEQTWDSVFIIDNLPQSHTVNLWMAHSADDAARVVRGQQDTARSAEKAKMGVELSEFPGQPDWNSWRPVLADWMNWVTRAIYDERSSSSSSSSSQSSSPS